MLFFFFRSSEGSTDSSSQLNQSFIDIFSCLYIYICLLNTRYLFILISLPLSNICSEYSYIKYLKSQTPSDILNSLLNVQIMVTKKHTYNIICPLHWQTSNIIYKIIENPLLNNIKVIWFWVNIFVNTCTDYEKKIIIYL